MTELPDLLTIQQLAEYLQVSDSTVRRMLKDGRLQGVSIARSGAYPKRPGEADPAGGAERQEIRGAWHLKQMANLVVVERIDRCDGVLLVNPFKNVDLEPLTPYKGYHPDKIESAVPVPDYVLRFYGLKRVSQDG